MSLSDGLTRTARLAAIALLLATASLTLSACGGDGDSGRPGGKTEEPEQSPTPGKASAEDLAQSVVMVAPGLGEASDFEPLATGSGTVVDTRGHILTNYHVINPDEVGAYDRIAIYTTDAAQAPPELAYFAGVAAWDENLDLAVVRIVENRNGVEIDPEDLDLAPADFGDPDDLALGDDLMVLGYPTIGEGALELTRGVVSGFLSSEGRRAVWIKTDARIAPGNSGGAAFNAAGKLVGVPTAVFYTEEFGAEVSGRVRPIDFAEDLIEDAQATKRTVIPEPSGQAGPGQVDVDIAAVFGGGPPFFATGDLGVDFVLTEEVFLSNEDRASLYDDPAEALQFYEDHGRLGGARRMYDNFESAGEAGILVMAQVDLYGTAQEASEAARVCEEYVDTMFEFLFDSGIDFYEPEDLGDPGVGDEGCYLFAEEVVEDPAEPPIEFDAIGFRLGPALAVVGVLSLPGSVTEDHVNSLATLELNALSAWLGVEAPSADGGYASPEDAIDDYIAYFELIYVGDCEGTDPATQAGMYCSLLVEDRGAERIYIVGLVASEPEAWLLLAQVADGSWSVADDAVLDPETGEPPW